MINPYLLLIFISFYSHSLLASNGMNMIGFGTRSIGMGGAVESVTNNNESMMINPAGLAALSSPEFNFSLSLLYPKVSHSDSLGNDVNESSQRSPLPLFSISRPTGHWVTGLGLFFQGGTGAEYEHLITPFTARKTAGFLPDPMGTIPHQDKHESRLMHLKLTPTIAYKLSSQIRLGASLNLSHARAKMSLFPDTSVAFDGDNSGNLGDSPNDMLYSGLDLENLSANGVGYSVGVQYQVNAWYFGASYTSQTKLDFDHGDAKLNMSAMGLGKVDYDAKLKGLSWPEEFAIGIGYQIQPWLLLTTDIAWINWSRAISSLDINFDDADHPMAPENSTLTMPMNWDDQIVWKVGMEYTPIDGWTFRFGYNHADTPMDSDYLRPIFPVISETHYTLGATHHIQNLDLSLSFEYVPKTKKTNDNSNPNANLFGPGSSELLSNKILTASLSYHF